MDSLAGAWETTGKSIRLIITLNYSKQILFYSDPIYSHLFVKAKTIKQYLVDKVVQCLDLSFDDFVSLNNDNWFEEIGMPAEVDFCQIEVQLLNQIFEDETEILQILVNAGDGKLEYGTVFFIFKDARCHWSNEIYQFIKGKPHPVSKGLPRKEGKGSECVKT